MPIRVVMMSERFVNESFVDLWLNSLYLGWQSGGAETELGEEGVALTITA
jgi:hypothetical protein